MFAALALAHRKRGRSQFFGTSDPTSGSVRQGELLAPPSPAPPSPAPAAKSAAELAGAGAAPPASPPPEPSTIGSFGKSDHGPVGASAPNVGVGGGVVELSPGSG